MTLPLPESFVDDPKVQRNLDEIAMQFPVAGKNLAHDVLRLATTGTSRKAAFGSATLTFPGGSAFSNSLGVTHGLGATPVAVLLTPHPPNASGTIFVYLNTPYDSTTFTVVGRSDNGANLGPTTRVFYWLAIA